MIQMVFLKNPTGPASETAFKFATDLIRKATEGQPAIRVKMLTSLATMNAQQVSDTINLLKAGTEAAKKAAPAAAPSTAQAVPGHYMIDGVHYQVKQSKLTKFSYVMKNGSYLGAKGPEAEAILAQVVANGKELAIAYAKVTSKCGICNTKLTDPKSIAAGIGPVCAEKF
jgi:hypothetical protein